MKPRFRIEGIDYPAKVGEFLTLEGTPSVTIEWSAPLSHLEASQVINEAQQRHDQRIIVTLRRVEMGGLVNVQISLCLSSWDSGCLTPKWYVAGAVTESTKTIFDHIMED